MAWFLRKAHAERVRRALSGAGIAGAIRRCGDPPEGWTVSEKDGFDLWVGYEDLKTAIDIYRQVHVLTMAVCSRCRNPDPTVHVTTVLPNGRQVAEHLCESCNKRQMRTSN